MGGCSSNPLPYEFKIDFEFVWGGVPPTPALRIQKHLHRVVTKLFFEFARKLLLTPRVTDSKTSYNWTVVPESLMSSSKPRAHQTSKKFCRDPLQRTPYKAEMHLLRVPTWESQSQVGEYEHDPNQHETFLRKHYGTTKSVCLACGLQETMSTNCSGTGNQADRLVTTTTLTHIALVLTAPKITRCNDATHTMEEVSVLKVSAVALQVYEQVSGEIWFENPKTPWYT